MRISDWSSDVCSSDLPSHLPPQSIGKSPVRRSFPWRRRSPSYWQHHAIFSHAHRMCRSEEHTSELRSLMRNSYAVFCLKKKSTPATPKPHHYSIAKLTSRALPHLSPTAPD